MSKALLDAALDAARRIELAGGQDPAAEEPYTVHVEVMRTHSNWWEDWEDVAAGVELAAVRLIDCDGDVSDACVTEDDVEEVRMGWADYAFDQNEPDGVGWEYPEWYDEDDDGSDDPHYLDYDSCPEDDE